MKQSIMYSPILASGLNMIDICRIIYSLQMKWIARLCKDHGLSWSQVIWDKVTSCIPAFLLPGLTAVTERDIQELPPFYRSTICSFAYVNSLFYEKNNKLPLQQNLFGTTFAPIIQHRWVKSGLLTLSDLPIQDGKINFGAVSNIAGSSVDLYVFYCMLQKNLSKYMKQMLIYPEPHPLLTT